MLENPRALVDPAASCAGDKHHRSGMIHDGPHEWTKSMLMPLPCFFTGPALKLEHEGLVRYKGAGGKRKRDSPLL